MLYLHTRTQVYNPKNESLGIGPDYTEIEIVLKLDDLIGVRQFVEDGMVYPDRSVVILKTGEEYGILSPYKEVVSKLCPPETFNEPLDFNLDPV